MGSTVNLIQQEFDGKSSLVADAGVLVSGLSDQVAVSANQVVDQLEVNRPKILQVSTTLSEWLGDVSTQKEAVKLLIRFLPFTFSFRLINS